MSFLLNQDKEASLEEVRLLSLAVDATDRAILILDEDMGIIYANRAFEELFGYTAEEVFVKRRSEILPGPDTDPSTIERLRLANQESRFIRADALFYSKSGNKLWMSTSISPFRDNDDQVTRRVIVFADITEAKQIQRLQHAVLEAIASGLPLSGVADLICRQVESIAPDVFSSMLLVDPAGRLHSLAGPRLPREYLSAFDGLSIGACAGSCGTAAFLGESVCVTDISTDPLWANYKFMALPLGFHACWSSPIKLRDGRIGGTFAFYYKEKRGPSPLHQEIVSACLHLSMIAIESDDARHKIAQLSHFDTLTGLRNRTFFYDKASSLLATNIAEDTAFFVIDLDHFKDVNDTLGHSVGDRVLVEVAYRIQKIVPPFGTVSRTGGDVFMILLPNCSVSRASAIADRILDALSVPIEFSGRTLTITSSIGISITRSCFIAPEVCVEQAVTAMQQAKTCGRACYLFYAPEQNQTAKDRFTLGNDLRSAIATASLYLVYQPKVSLQTLELTGIEALSRWNHPIFGDIPPEKFVALAEEIGQSDAIGYWSLREACRQMSLWRHQGIAVPNVSVNLSPHHFLNLNLCAWIEGILAEFQLPASCLTIEITEGVMVNQNHNGLATARALHDIGIGLSIDDFGTGFSSLSRLTQLPLNELKLDRSFVRDFEDDPNAQAVTKAVISIGQSLGMTVVSEGVETQKQAELLKRLGCPVAQGFFFGRPVPADLLEAQFLRKTEPVVGFDQPITGEWRVAH